MEISVKEMAELVAEAKNLGAYEGSKAAKEDSKTYYAGKEAHYLDRISQLIDDKDMLEDKVYILENKLANVQCSKSTLEMWMRIQGVIEKTDTAGQLPLMAALDREFRPVDAVLVSYPREKLVPVIRLLRELYSLGLKDAKDLAESIPNAKIQESLDAQEFEILRIRFEEIGARISKRSIGSVDRVQNSEVLDLEQVKEAAEDLNSHQYGCANEDCQNSESFAGPQNCPDCGQPGCQLNN